MNAENTGKQQRGKPFQKGRSGNPMGRPRGSRNKISLAAEALLEGQAEKLTQKAIDMALEGNQVALKLCLERILPPRRDRIPTFDGFCPDTLEGTLQGLSQILLAVNDGDLSPDQAHSLSRVLEIKRKAIETIEIERRVSVLEGPK